MSAGFLCNNPIFLLHSLLTLSWMGDLEKIYSTWYLRFLLISCQLLSWSAYVVPIKKFNFHFSLTRNAQLWINARTGGCYKCCGHIIWGGSLKDTEICSLNITRTKKVCILTFWIFLQSELILFVIWLQSLFSTN